MSSSVPPPSFCAPDPVLSSCTVLLLRAQDPRAPHSFAASACGTKTRPLFGYDRACSIKIFIPQPLQVAGISCGIRPYLRRRLSQKSSLDNSVPLRRWGKVLSHAPFLVALWRRLLSWPPINSFRLNSSPSSTCIFARLAARVCSTYAYPMAYVVEGRTS